MSIVNAVVGSDADLQQGLRAPARRDHDARNKIDEHDSTGPHALDESTGLLGDLAGAAQLGRHPLGNWVGKQRPINPAHHVWRQQREQSGDITATGSLQKRFHNHEVFS